GRVDKHQHFLSAAGGLGRKVTLVQDLLETRGIVLAVLEAAQIAVQLDPIVQNPCVNRARFAHESLLREAVKTSSAQPDRCKRLYILHAVYMDLVAIIHLYQKEQSLWVRLTSGSNSRNQNL